MATEGAAGVDSQLPSSQVQRSGEGVSTCFQEEGHLAWWKALHDSLPDTVGVLQFCNFKDLTVSFFRLLSWFSITCCLSSLLHWLLRWKLPVSVMIISRQIHEHKCCKLKEARDEDNLLDLGILLCYFFNTHCVVINIRSQYNSIWIQSTHTHTHIHTYILAHRHTPLDIYTNAKIIIQKRKELLFQRKILYAMPYTLHACGIKLSVIIILLLATRLLLKLIVIGVVGIPQVEIWSWQVRLKGVIL